MAKRPLEKVISKKTPSRKKKVTRIPLTNSLVVLALEAAQIVVAEVGTRSGVIKWSANATFVPAFDGLRELAKIQEFISIIFLDDRGKFEAQFKALKARGK